MRKVSKIALIHLLVDDELREANEVFDETFNSMHEGFAVLQEEVDELWDDIKGTRGNDALLEAIQVAAMAIKFVDSFATHNLLVPIAENRKVLPLKDGRILRGAES